MLIQNNVSPLGLTGKVLIEEFNRATDLDNSSWASDSLPFASRLRAGPDPAQMVAQGSTSIKDGFLGLLAKLELVEESLIKEKRRNRDPSQALKGSELSK